MANDLHYILHNQTPKKMKKIITIIAIVLLTAGTSFAGNNTTSNNNSQTHQITNSQTTVVVTISDMTGKTVYTETYTTENTDNVNIKLNPSNKLTKGMYVVTVTIEGQKMTQKLVVE